MDLSQKTIEICKEISEVKQKTIEPNYIKVGFFNRDKIYLGMKPKKKFGISRAPPLFKLFEEHGKIILTSLSRNYDEIIKKIAKKNNFAYTFEESSSFEFYIN